MTEGLHFRCAAHCFCARCQFMGCHDGLNDTFRCSLHNLCVWQILTFNFSGKVRASSHNVAVLFGQDTPQQERIVVLYTKHYRSANVVERHTGITSDIMLWGATAPHPASTCLTPPKPWYSLLTRNHPPLCGICVCGLRASCWGPPVQLGPLIFSQSMCGINSDIDSDPSANLQDCKRQLQQLWATLHGSGYDGCTSLFHTVLQYLSRFGGSTPYRQCICSVVFTALLFV